MARITRNFDSYEFDCNCGCRLNNIRPEVVHRLQVLRDLVQTPIIVLSGTRCPSHNEAVGGAPRSYHLSGMAIDWKLVDSYTKYTMHELYHMLINWDGGIHYYWDEGFIHIDIGPYRRWTT